MKTVSLSCPICGETLEPQRAGNVRCVCGFVAMNALQVQRVRDKIGRAARMASSTARVNAMHETPGARVLAVGTNADGAAVLVGFIPAGGES